MTGEPDLEAARRELERFAAGRGLAVDDAEDVVQEGLTRLLENRGRLHPDAWPVYAVVSAANLLRDRERAADVHRRHAHRLHAPDVSSGPEELLLSSEEHEALRQALEQLPQQDAALLREHHVGGASDAGRRVAPATAARLARARARLRVSYVLAHGRVALPTQRCRPVLEAVSSGERRRQERSGTGRHLSACGVCATYAPALLERRRALAALNPLTWLGIAGAAVADAVRRHPGRSSTAGATAAVVLVAGVVLLPAEPAPAEPAPALAAPLESAEPAVDLVVAGQAVLDRLGEPGLPLGPVTATRLPVQDVPADEGFWVGDAPGRRLWVELVGEGESPVQVRPGDRVSFRGTTVRSSPEYPAAVGLSRERGADELVQMCRYVEVAHAELVVEAT